MLRFRHGVDEPRRGRGELEEAEAGKAAKVAKAERTPSPERVDVGLARALLAVGGGGRGDRDGGG